MKTVRWFLRIECSEKSPYLTGLGCVYMLDPQRNNRDELQSCPRCNARMIEIVTIAPMLDEPGLIAYECSKCGYVESELQQPKQLG